MAKLRAVGIVYFPPLGTLTDRLKEKKPSFRLDNCFHRLRTLPILVGYSRSVVCQTLDCVILLLFAEEGGVHGGVRHGKGSKH